MRMKSNARDFYENLKAGVFRKALIETYILTFWKKNKSVMLMISLVCLSLAKTLSQYNLQLWWQPESLRYLVCFQNVASTRCSSDCKLALLLEDSQKSIETIVWSVSQLPWLKGNWVNSVVILFFPRFA